MDSIRRFGDEPIEIQKSVEIELDRSYLYIIGNGRNVIWVGSSVSAGTGELGRLLDHHSEKAPYSALETVTRVSARVLGSSHSYYLVYCRDPSELHQKQALVLSSLGLGRHTWLPVLAPDITQSRIPAGQVSDLRLRYTNLSVYQSLSPSEKLKTIKEFDRLRPRAERKAAA